MSIRTRYVCLASALVLLIGGCRRAGPAVALSAVTPGTESCRLALAPVGVSGPLGESIASLQRRAREGTFEAAVLEQLGYALVAQARLVADDGLYDTALQAASCLESKAAGSLQAQLLRGHVRHQQHRFAEAEAIARPLVSARGSALDFGLLGDALMEQGKLDEAATAYQRMIDLKPFYQSYTRAAHLRWLKGDLEGAIDVMRLAVSAASPRDPEAGPWARTRLAYYYLHAGRLDAAAAATRAVLDERPAYAPALIVRGRLALAQHRAAAAVGDLREAVRIQALPEAQWLLAEALRETGDAAGAAAIESALTRDAAARDPRTCALFLATRGLSIETAVGLARRELLVRQDVFTEDAVAWALAAAGRHDEARAHMTRALSYGTEDPRLFLHAGTIAMATGRRAEGVRWLRRARALDRLLLPSERRLLEQAARAHG